MPAFYYHPKIIQDIFYHAIGKKLDHLACNINYSRDGEKQECELHFY